MSNALAGIPDAKLLVRVQELVQRGNSVESELLAHLGEVEARQLYLEEGCSSMFAYCQRVLHFAEGVAYKRIQAARVARRHPQVLEALRSGELHLTAVSLLAPKLTEGNCAELVAAAKHLGADEIRRMLADREPRPAVPSSVRRIVPPIEASACPAAEPPASATPPIRTAVVPDLDDPQGENRAARRRALLRPIHR
jgi:hypothetical protein